MLKYIIDRKIYANQKRCIESCINKTLVQTTKNYFMVKKSQKRSNGGRYSLANYYKKY